MPEGFHVEIVGQDNFAVRFGCPDHLWITRPGEARIAGVPPGVALSLEQPPELARQIHIQ